MEVELKKQYCKGICRWNESKLIFHPEYICIRFVRYKGFL